MKLDKSSSQLNSKQFNTQKAMRRNSYEKDQERQALGLNWVVEKIKIT